MFGEDVGSKEAAVKPPRDGFTAFLDGHTPCPKHSKMLKLGIAESTVARLTGRREYTR